VLLELLARGVGRNREPVDQLAVQLHDQLDLLVGQQLRIGLRPGLLPDPIARDALVDLGAQVRGEREHQRPRGGDREADV
jgi:hypothetical protein